MPGITDRANGQACAVMLRRSRASAGWGAVIQSWRIYFITFGLTQNVIFNKMHRLSRMFFVCFILKILPILFVVRKS